MLTFAICLLLPSVSLAARECDQLTRRYEFLTKQPDILWRLNRQTNNLLKQAVADFNTRSKESTQAIDQSLAWHYLALYIHNELARENRWPLPTEEENIPYAIDVFYALGKSGKGPLQSWLEDPATQGQFLEHLDNDVYATAYPSGFNDSNSVKVGGYLVGTDKIDHFFDQGYAYWRISDYGQNDALAIAYGVDSEWGLYGIAASGVFAFADLRANWAGYRFFKLLKLYFKYDGRNFRQIKDFNWANWVDWQWDEVLNPSYFTPAMYDTIHNYIEDREAQFRRGLIDYSYYPTCQKLEAETLRNKRKYVRSTEYLNDKIPINLPSYASLIASLDDERLQIQNTISKTSP